MHQVRKSNRWHFGMKAHIGVDADSDLVRTQGRGLLHGKKAFSLLTPGIKMRQRGQKS